MTLAFANHCAARLLEWLSPFCERLDVAGSVRRLRPTVNDLDLVAVPRFAVETDLLGGELARCNLLWAAIARRVAESPDWRIDRGGSSAADGQCTFTARGVQVDIWTATPETWGTVLLCRTGSKEHNIWLSERAKRMGGHWQPHEGVTLEGVRQPADTEEAVYAALGLPFIPPREREAALLRGWEAARA